MATRKPNLPEVIVDSGEIVTQSEQAAKYRSQVNELTAKETAAKEALVLAAEKCRQELEGSGRYVGLVRAAESNVRTEFRMGNGAIHLSEEARLEKEFGALRPLIFGREKAITAIIDPAGLLKELKDRGYNPWDYVELKVKEGSEMVLAESKHVNLAEAFLPREGFLNTINEVASRLSDKAREYLKTYLKPALKPTVVISNGD